MDKNTERQRIRELYARNLRRFVNWARKWRQENPGWTSRQVLEGEEVNILRREWNNGSKARSKS